MDKGAALYVVTMRRVTRGGRATPEQEDAKLSLKTDEDSSHQDQKWEGWERLLSKELRQALLAHLG